MSGYGVPRQGEGAPGRPRILVVEDEAIIAKDIQRRLEKNGYEVSSIVSTGSGAIGKVEKDAPDLVLMDIVLPGEFDGIDAARLIRSRYDIPIIYVTAYADEAVLERAIPTEPFGYITKPFEDDELCRTIEMGLFKHRMERRLRESEEWLSTTLRSIGDGVIATDRDGRVRFMNPVAESLTGWKGESASGRRIAEVFTVPEGQKVPDPSCPAAQVQGGELTVSLQGECTLLSGKGDEKIVTCSGAPIIDGGGVTVGAVLVFRDVTAEKRAQRELECSREELKVQAEEIRERNTALKVLLGQREADRLEFEERVLSNISHLVLPYIEKLKLVRLEAADRSSVSVLESNLRQITSSFSSTLSSSLTGLTPQEIRIANLVKEGRQDKEVSDILNISLETVKTHKQNIRKKFGIYGQRKNLRSYLSRFSE